MGYITERSRAPVDVSISIGKSVRFECIPLSGVILSSGSNFTEISRPSCDMKCCLARMQRSSHSGTFPIEKVDPKHTRPQSNRSVSELHPVLRVVSQKQTGIVHCCLKNVHFTFPAKNGLLLFFSVVVSGNNSTCLTQSEGRSES